MPPPTYGDELPDSPEDADIVQLIQALSGLQDPARAVYARAQVVLEARASRLGEAERRNLTNIAECCELLGPSSTRAITDLVAALGGESTR